MVIAPTWPEFDLSLVAMSGLSWLLVLQSTLRGFSPGSHKVHKKSPVV